MEKSLENPQKKRTFAENFHMWVILALLSAIFLGCYDVCKKRSVDKNSVTGVLTFSVCISALLLLPTLIAGKVPSTDLQGHLFIFIKSAMVLSSWVCAYIALKHLPITIVAPMQASRPIWTLLGALFIFHETLNGWQWAGVACALGSIFLFSFSVKKSGHHEKKQIFYFVFLILSILLGSASGLYDKFIMRHYDNMTVQVYYTFYQAAMMLIFYAFHRHQKKANPFHFRWEVVGISIFITLSDYVYLKALSDPDSLIAIVSTIRRSGAIIPFLYGIIFLHEKQVKAKIFCLIGIFIGLIFLLFGSGVI